jgi:hypothetical protein
MAKPDLSQRRDCRETEIERENCKRKGVPRIISYGPFTGPILRGAVGKTSVDSGSEKEALVS